MAVTLEYLNLAKFNTINVKSMNFIFSYCWNLSEINVSNFNTDNLEQANLMFTFCIKLEEMILVISIL